MTGVIAGGGVGLTLMISANGEGFSLRILKTAAVTAETIVCMLCSDRMMDAGTGIVSKASVSGAVGGMVVALV